MTTDAITDHVQRALDLLPAQWYEDANVQALTASLASETQPLEDAICAVLVAFHIDTATGAQLDVLGALVGRDRNGQDDATYRRYIRAEVSTLRSSGRGEQLIAIARLVLGSDDTYTVNLIPQAINAVVVRILDVALTCTLAEDLISFLARAVGAGIKIHAEYYTALAADLLTFEPVVTFVDAGGVSATDTSVPTLFDPIAAGFPPADNIIIEEGSAVEETVAYSARTTTGFTTAALANDHDENATIALVGSDGSGFTDALDYSVGGHFVGVKAVAGGECLAFPAVSVIASDIENLAGGSTYDTDSFTPAADSVVYFVISNFKSGSSVPSPAVTSDHGTWDLIDSQTFDTTSIRVSVYRLAAGATPATDTISIDFGEAEQASQWAVLQAYHVDNTGVNGADSIGAIDGVGAGSGTTIATDLTALETDRSGHLLVVCRETSGGGAIVGSITEAAFDEIVELDGTTDDYQTTVLFSYSEVDADPVFASSTVAAISMEIIPNPV